MTRPREAKRSRRGDLRGTKQRATVSPQSEPWQPRARFFAKNACSLTPHDAHESFLLTRSQSTRYKRRHTSGTTEKVIHRTPPPNPHSDMESSTPMFNATTSPFLEAAQKSAPWLIGWLSFLLPMLNSPYVQESLRFFFLGSVLETGRRIFQWTLDRFTSGFFVTAHFNQGDWAYDWLNEFLVGRYCMIYNAGRLILTIDPSST